jgi:hypothetical protein
MSKKTECIAVMSSTEGSEFRSRAMLARNEFRATTWPVRLAAACLMIGTLSMTGCALLPASWRSGAQDESLRKQVHADSFPSAKQVGL